LAERRGRAGARVV